MGGTLPCNYGNSLAADEDSGARGAAACPPVRLSAFLAHDREGLILLSRDIDFLEQTLHLSGPENLYAELRPGRTTPRDTGRRTPAGAPVRGHQRSGRRATLRIGAGTGCSAPSR